MDGLSGQVITTDGAGQLNFKDIPTLSVGSGLTDNGGRIELGGEMTDDIDLIRTTQKFEISTNTEGANHFNAGLRLKDPEPGGTAAIQLSLTDTDGVGRSSYMRMTDQGIEDGGNRGMTTVLAANDRALRNVSSIRLQSGSTYNEGGSVVVGDPFGGWSFKGMYYNVNTHAKNTGENSNPRWVPDKLYADSYFAGHSLTDLVKNPSLSEDGSFLSWNNSLKQYQLEKIDQPTFGAESQIPVSNTDGTGFNYSSGLTFNGTNFTVDGKITSEEIKVEVVNAPDYVLDKNYDLRTIEETEKFINRNSHLPEVPSAKEMEENGVEVGEMSMLLLKKIEELMLYTIQQQKLIERQADENQELADRIKKLESRKD